MKNLVYIILFFCQAILAQDAAFSAGNDLYRKGKYPEAAAAYENILKSGKHSSELYFNLGNAYYKQSRVAPAILNYERALLIDPNDDEILTNLEFAKKLQIDEVKEVPSVGFNKLIRDFTSSISYDAWAYSAVVFAFVSLILFAGYYFSQRTLIKRIYFISMFLALLVIVIAILAAIFEKSSQASERAAIVFADIVVVKGEPSADAADAFVLHEGTKVYVLENLDNWRKITLPDGSKGWIEEKAIREIRP